MIKTTPMSETRLEYLRGFGYTKDSVYKYHPTEDLKEKLFEVGGEAVIISDVSKKEVRLLMSKGEFVDGTGAKLWKQKAGDCHGNVERTVKQYAEKGKADKFLPKTGFALSEDGAWRFHSWLFDTDNNQVVETTESRLMYFGITDSTVV